MPQIPPFGMLNSQPTNKNIISKSKFLFECKEIPNTTYNCQSVNIPGLEISVLDQHTTFNPVKLPGGTVRTDYLSLKFLVDEDWKNWSEIRNWILRCSTYENYEKYVPSNQHYSENATLFVLVNENQPNIKVTFSHLFPKKLSNIVFNTTTPQYEPVVAEVTFAYTTFNLENLRTGEITT